ncbi:MAG: thiol:disulfide interchange protein, partial [Rhizobiales bacterium 39-66-18]
MSDRPPPPPAVAVPAAKRRRPLLVLLPVVAFGLLAALFLVRLFAGDPSQIPSALVGR